MCHFDQLHIDSSCY